MARSRDPRQSQHVAAIIALLLAVQFTPQLFASDESATSEGQPRANAKHSESTALHENGTPRLGAEDQSDPPPADSPAERERKEQIRQQVRRGFQVLLVLVLLAVLVSVMFLLWGMRLRRQLRQPLPPVHKGDELWFLKPAHPKPDDHRSDTPTDSPSPPADEPPENPNAG